MGIVEFIQWYNDQPKEQSEENLSLRDPEDKIWNAMEGGTDGG